jgi:hypothetical protein
VVEITQSGRVTKLVWANADLRAELKEAQIKIVEVEEL